MENLFPDIARRVCRELRDVSENPLEGIHVIINEQDMTDIQVSYMIIRLPKAVIDGPVGTPYAGGKFRVKLVLPDRYPVEPPKAFICTKIFHPNIAPGTGEVCVNVLKKDWKSDLGVRHILLTIKCLLIDPNPKSALNEEAGKLILEDYDEYVAQAKLFTEIHACQHLRDQHKVSVPITGDTVYHKPDSLSCNAGNVLRDTNAPSRTQSGLKSEQKSISIAKKALKRL